MSVDRPEHQPSMRESAYILSYRRIVAGVRDACPTKRKTALRRSSQFPHEIDLSCGCKLRCMTLLATHEKADEAKAAREKRQGGWQWRSAESAANLILNENDRPMLGANTQILAPTLASGRWGLGKTWFGLS